MNRLLTCLVIFPFLLSTVFADDPTGWQEIAWGSQPNAFQSVSGIVPLAEPSTEVFRGEELTAEFGLEEYRIAGVPFAVKFYFDHFGVFSAYTLTYSGEPGKTADAFDEIVRLLGKKYKRSSRKNVDDWTFGSGDLVSASLIEDQEGPSQIKISYLDTNTEELEKL